MSGSYEDVPAHMSRGTLFYGPKPGRPYTSKNPAKQQDEASGDEDYTFLDSDYEEEENGAASSPSSQEEYEEVYLKGAGAKPTERRRRAKKPVTTSLDRHDTLLFQMKLDGKTDREIARTLAGNGLDYSEKSVATRFRRIQLKKKKEADANFEAGKRTWSAEEDIFLLESFDEAEEAMQRDILRIKTRQWQYVEKKLASHMPEAFISAAACRERLSMLMKPEPEHTPGSASRFKELVPETVFQQYAKDLQLQSERDKAYEVNLLLDVKAQMKEYKRILAREAADDYY